MSKLVRIDEDCEAILRTYSEGSLSDCIHAMQQKLTIGVTVVTGEKAQPILTEEIKKAITEAIHKDMGNLKDSIRTTNNEFMQFIGSGQGAVTLRK